MTDHTPLPSPFLFIGIAVQRELTPGEMVDYLTPLLIPILEMGVQAGRAETPEERQWLSAAASHLIAQTIDHLGTVIHTLAMRALRADEAEE